MKPRIGAESDLETQLESLLHTVWECERRWAVEDRIDLAIRIAEAQRRGL